MKLSFLLKHVQCQVVNLFRAKMDDESDSEFWKEIENEINEPIPKLIKIFLAKCGYNSRICIRKITLDDVILVEKFVTDNCKEMLKHVKNAPEYADLKIHRTQSFEFLPGHRKFIVNIGEMLAYNLDSKNNHPETDEWRQPLTDKRSTQLKNEFFSSIMKWARNKKLNQSVNKYIQFSSCCILFYFLFHNIYSSLTESIPA